MQSTSTVLMIRPVNFHYNIQTAESNKFQFLNEEQQHAQENAEKEFDALVNMLQTHEVEVLVVEDTAVPPTPDSIFPNNWISTHPDGSIYLYPMKAENRRLERRTDLLDLLYERFEITRVNDLSFFEKEMKFLEGTGSMVLDRKHYIAYASLSIRTSVDPLNRFCTLSGYRSITFNAVDENRQPVYHTNVMMSIGEKFVIICLDTIKDEQEKKQLVDTFIVTGKEIVQISMEQMKNFAANALQLKSKKNEQLLIMSERAHHALSQPQLMQLSKFCKILHVPLDTIENNGGGSARCMIAEIYLPIKE